MKALYEVTNGWLGESQICAYVWAESEDEAKTLATATFKADAAGGRYPPHYWQNLRYKLLFKADAPSFATTPSGSGWSE